MNYNNDILFLYKFKQNLEREIVFIHEGERLETVHILMHGKGKNSKKSKKLSMTYYSVLLTWNMRRENLAIPDVGETWMLPRMFSVPSWRPNHPPLEEGWRLPYMNFTHVCKWSLKGKLWKWKGHWKPIWFPLRNRFINRPCPSPCA